MKYGRLTVLDDSTEIWTLKCDCGEVIKRHKHRIKYGDTKSCGCLRRETTARKNFVHGKSKNNRIYRIWKNMNTRCHSTGDFHYKWYGGRGISICEEWSEFDNFYAWSVSNGYEETLTIDRIDNDGNYCPNNCRWVSMKVQNNNSRNTINARKIEIFGSFDTISNHAERYGLHRETLRNRYKKGLRDEELVKPSLRGVKHG